jgi:shikimate dehydrogenase
MSPAAFQPRPLSVQTQLCMSLSGRPGTFGTRFHNYLYAALGLDYVYKAFTTTDLPAAIAGVRALGIRGCAVSMPYKEASVALVDELGPPAASIGSVNTIVNTGGLGSGQKSAYAALGRRCFEVRSGHHSRPIRTSLSGSATVRRGALHIRRSARRRSGLNCIQSMPSGRVSSASPEFCPDPKGGVLRAYNTDYLAVQQLIHGLDPALKVVLRGSGGMARAVACALRDAGFRHGVILARSEAAGRALAAQCGYVWQPALTGAAELLVNVTPIGMSGGPEANDLAFELDMIAAAQVIFDVVALPAETPLIRAARAAGKTVISGAEVAALQAFEQFVLYTGVRPSPEQVQAAAAYARQSV